VTIAELRQMLAIAAALERTGDPADNEAARSLRRYVVVRAEQLRRAAEDEARQIDQELIYWWRRLELIDDPALREHAEAVQRHIERSLIDLAASFPELVGPEPDDPTTREAAG
jgi:hypothetical protein